MYLLAYLLNIQILCRNKKWQKWILKIYVISMTIEKDYQFVHSKYAYSQMTPILKWNQTNKRKQIVLEIENIENWHLNIDIFKIYWLLMRLNHLFWVSFNFLCKVVPLVYGQKISETHTVLRFMVLIVFFEFSGKYNF